MTTPKPVWVVIIEHKHGRNVSVHPNEEHGLASLARYVDEYWDYEVGQHEKRPSDNGEMISTYFDYMCDHESYAIEQCDLEG